MMIMVTAGDAIRDRDATPGQPRSLGHFRREQETSTPTAPACEEFERIWRAVRDIA